MRWMRNTYEILVTISEGKNPFRKLLRKCEDNIKKNLEELV